MNHRNSVIQGVLAWPGPLIPVHQEGEQLKQVVGCLHLLHVHQLVHHARWLHWGSSSCDCCRGHQSYICAAAAAGKLFKLPAILGRYLKIDA